MAEINEECEFCGDIIDFTQQCSDCGVETHEQCMDSSADSGSMCPYCSEWNYYSSGQGDDYT